MVYYAGYIGYIYYILRLDTLYCLLYLFYCFYIRAFLCLVLMEENVLLAMSYTQSIIYKLFVDVFSYGPIYILLVS